MGYVFATSVTSLVTLVGLATFLGGFVDREARAWSIPGSILFVGGMILYVFVDIREVLIAHTRRIKDGNE